MSMDEQKNIHPDYDRRDPFSLFMFGGKRNEEEVQHTDLEALNMKKEISRNQQEKLSLDELLLGKRSKEPRNTDKNNGSEEQSQLNSLLNNVNVEELIGNIDTLMNSASQFKPLWKKITPLVNKWMK